MTAIGNLTRGSTGSTTFYTVLYLDKFGVRVSRGPFLSPGAADRFITDVMGARGYVTGTAEIVETPNGRKRNKSSRRTA